MLVKYLFVIDYRINYGKYLLNKENIVYFLVDWFVVFRAIGTEKF